MTTKILWLLGLVPLIAGRGGKDIGCALRAGAIDRRPGAARMRQAGDSRGVRLRSLLGAATGSGMAEPSPFREGIR